jgi:hypothetical protein
MLITSPRLPTRAEIWVDAIAALCTFVRPQVVMWLVVLQIVLVTGEALG